MPGIGLMPRLSLRYSAQARVWYVQASNVPGLHAEAATLRELAAIIADVMPDLLEANGILKDAGLTKAF